MVSSGNEGFAKRRKEEEDQWNVFGDLNVSLAYEIRINCSLRYLNDCFMPEARMGKDRERRRAYIGQLWMNGLLSQWARNAMETPLLRFLFNFITRNTWLPIWLSYNQRLWVNTNLLASRLPWSPHLFFLYSFLICVVLPWKQNNWNATRWVYGGWLQSPVLYLENILYWVLFSAWNFHPFKQILEMNLST